MTLKNHDDKAIRIGDILTLVCEVKGSSNLKFEWYKDGAPVNVSLTNRNIYIMNIPKANPETRMSVLDIDKATKLDAGKEFFSVHLILSSIIILTMVLYCKVLSYYFVNKHIPSCLSLNSCQLPVLLELNCNISNQNSS